MLQKIKFFLKLSFVLCALSSPALSTLTPETEDRFDFLSKKYPSLAIEAEKPFALCDEEKCHYTKLNIVSSERNISSSDILIESAKIDLAKNTLHFFGEEHEQALLNQIGPMFSTLEQDHSRHGYFKIFFEKSLKNHTFFENILLAAEYIFQTIQDEGGGTALFLGRTPCLIQVAYEEVLQAEQDETQIPLHLNFSGHPDALTRRESLFFSSKQNITRDIVTDEKLHHYFSYLDEKNILDTKRLYIVDIIGSGGSLNSFLRVINAYYVKHQVTPPEFSFLNLTADMNWSTNKSDFYTFQCTGNKSNQGILTLHESAERNIKPFQINTTGVPIFYKVPSVLDRDMFQEFVVHGIQYPAQKWTPEFDNQRTAGGVYHTNLYNWLRPRFSNLITEHKKQILHKA